MEIFNRYYIIYYNHNLLNVLIMEYLCCFPVQLHGAMFRYRWSHICLSNQWRLPEAVQLGEYLLLWHFVEADSDSGLGGQFLRSKKCVDWINGFELRDIANVKVSTNRTIARIHPVHFIHQCSIETVHGPWLCASQSTCSRLACTLACMHAYSFFIIAINLDIYIVDASMLS